MIGPPSPAVLRRAAATATLDARTAWTEACDNPDEEHTRAAFRQCVLADRIVRRAADTLQDGDERRRMIEDADRIKAAAGDLKARLARIVEDGPVGDLGELLAP
jgi:hypothetical protein